MELADTWGNYWLLKVWLWSQLVECNVETEPNGVIIQYLWPKYFRSCKHQPWRISYEMKHRHGCLLPFPITEWYLLLLPPACFQFSFCIAPKPTIQNSPTFSLFGNSWPSKPRPEATKLTLICTSHCSNEPSNNQIPHKNSFTLCFWPFSQNRKVFGMSVQAFSWNPTFQCLVAQIINLVTTVLGLTLQREFHRWSQRSSPCLHGPTAHPVVAHPTEWGTWSQPVFLVVSAPFIHFVRALSSMLDLADLTWDLPTSEWALFNSQNVVRQGCH